MNRVRQEKNIRNIVALERIITLGDTLDAQQKETVKAIELFSSFLDMSPVVAWIKDFNGKFVWVNARLCRVFERPSEHWIGKSDYDFLPEETARMITENDRIVMDTGDILHLNEQVPTPDAKMHEWVVFKFPVTVNLIKYVGGMAMDINIVESEIVTCDEENDA